MPSNFVAQLRRVTRWLLTSAAPEELAAGFTLGMMIGIMPKSNLIALSLCVLLFSLRCNKGLGLAAAIAFSFVSQHVDPFAHKLGLVVLQFKSLQGAYAATFNLPLGPWLACNNTVVVGTLLVGLYVAFPVYFAVRVVSHGLNSAFARQPGARLGLDAELQPGMLS